MSGYATALGLTLAVELPLAVAVAPRDERWHVGRVALLLNLFTHPLAFLAYRERLASFEAVELAVLAAETVGYRVACFAGWRRALGVALLTNGTTAALSILLA